MLNAFRCAVCGRQTQSEKRRCRFHLDDLEVVEGIREGIARREDEARRALAGEIRDDDEIVRDLTSELDGRADRVSAKALSKLLGLEVEVVQALARWLGLRGEVGVTVTRQGTWMLEAPAWGARVARAGDEELWSSVWRGELGEALELEVIPPESVDVVVTSPPYKERDGYTEALPHQLGALIARVLKPGGRAWINFGQLREDFARPFLCRAAVEEGARGLLWPGQTVIWAKSVAVHGEQRGHYQPLNSTKVLNYGFEFVFGFFKHPEPDLDRLSIGVPYTDKNNLSRGTRGQHGDLHCAGDVWFVPHKTRGRKSKKAHAHEFPEELVTRCLRVSGVRRGAVVLDPFAGGGTTAAVARGLGCSSYGIERDPRVAAGALERWRETDKETD